MCFLLYEVQKEGKIMYDTKSYQSGCHLKGSAETRECQGNIWDFISFSHGLVKWVCSFCKSCGSSSCYILIILVYLYMSIYMSIYIYLTF